MSAGYFFAPSAAASHCETPSAGKALPNSALSILSVPVCFFCIYLWILFILCNVTIRSITVSRLHTAIPICNCSGEICSSQSMSITSLSDQTFSCPISSILKGICTDLKRGFPRDLAAICDNLFTSHAGIIRTLFPLPPQSPISKSFLDFYA